MSKRGVYAVFVGCVLINLVLKLDQPRYVLNNIAPRLSVIVVNVTIGLALLFFPLIGLLADVCSTRYQMIRASFAVLSTTLIIHFLLEDTIFVVLDGILQKRTSKYFLVEYVICMVIINFGICLFEAKAIQFGMDQLLEAPSTQLSQFIHWYFWFMHIGQRIVLLCAFRKCTFCFSFFQHLYKY